MLIFALPEHNERPDASHLEQNTVEDEPESQDGTHTMGICEPQNITLPIMLHSSLDAITFVCDEVRAMDLQEDLQKIPPKQKQIFALRNPHIWVSTLRQEYVPLILPQIEVLRHHDDRMLHPRIFKQIQKLYNYIFTLDACANSKGDNVLCSRYYFPEGLFLSRDLKGEFVWINPPFQRANESLEAYFTQKMLLRSWTPWFHFRFLQLSNGLRWP